MSVTVEQLLVEVKADVRQALAGLSTLEAKQTSLIGKTSKMARGMGLAFGGAAVVGGIVKTMNLAKNFDLTMRQVGVQTGQTGDQIKGLSDLALQMGKDTVFSAQDAGGAMLELAKGGLSAAQIKAGALQTTMTLAAAGGLDLASAATYITQGMNTFGISADKANQITTALAGGANASTASVESLGMALSQAGAGATNAGMSIQETVAALAAFDNAGIKGSDAGTSLKTMLSNLVPATDEAREAMGKYGLEFVKRNGDFKSMAQVAGELQQGLGGLSRAERVAAMRTIFGSDATRAATVLMKEGSKGVRDYVKATKDRTSAEDMANATMEGASGAWENFTGSVETAAIQLGTKFLPAMTKGLDAASNFVSEAMTWGPQIDESFGWMIDGAKGLGDALKPLASMTVTVAGAIGDLPGPVKEAGVQAAVAALIMPRLAAGVSAAGASMLATSRSAYAMATAMTTAGGRASMTATQTARMGGIMSTAAGVGGILALSAASKTSNAALSTLGTTAGGAALGFSVAGPLGAALGGTAGLLYGLDKASGKAKDQFTGTIREANALGEEVGTAEAWAAVGKAAYDRLKESLDQLTGAYGAATAASVYNGLQEQGTFKNLDALGLSRRDVVRATMGEADALRRVNAALDPHKIKTEQAYQAAMALEGGIKGVGGTLRQSSRDLRAAADATQPLIARLGVTRAEMGKIPKNVRVKIRNDVPDNMKEIRGLAKQVGGLDRKTARILIEAANIDPTRKRIDGVTTALKRVNNAKPNLKPWANQVGNGVNDGKRQAEKGQRELALVLGPGMGKIKPNLKPWNAAVVVAAQRAVGEGRRGASAVGTAMQAGVLAGFSGTQSALAAQAVAAVRGAIAAAKAAAKIKSPSRVMRDEVGKPLGEGLVVGLKAKKSKAHQAGRDLMRNTIKGMTAGFKEAQRYLKGVSRWVRKYMAGEQEDRFVDRVANANKRLEKLYDQRSRIQKRLATAQERLANRRQESASFRDSTVQGMTAQANVTNAGSTAGAIASSLVAQVAKVREFARLLKRLRKMGFRDQIIQELSAAGVEGGLAAARALSQATVQEKNSINSSYAEIYGTATKTAKDLATAMFGAGIKSAEGVVKGLKSKEKQLKEFILTIAKAMKDAIYEALGLKPPGKGGKGGNGGNGNGGGGGGQGNGRMVADTYARTVTPDAMGVSTGKAVSLTFNTYNPVAEPQSRTTNKALARAASIGLV